MTGNDIAASLRSLIQDEDADAYRYSDVDLLRWLNEFYTALCILVPSECLTSAFIALVAGVKQRLPDGATSLKAVTRNSNGTVISMTSRSAIEAFVPDWYSMTPSATVKHYMPDLSDPLAFYTYPPAEAGTQVEVEYSGPAPQATTLSEAFKVKDQYAPAAVNYLAYRLYSKDQEDAANMQAATAYYAAFRAAAGVA